MIASDSFAPGLSLSGTPTIDVGGCGLAEAATRSVSKKAETLGVLDKVSSLLRLWPEAERPGAERPALQRTTSLKRIVPGRSTACSAACGLWSLTPGEDRVQPARSLAFDH